MGSRVEQTRLIRGPSLLHPRASHHALGARWDESLPLPGAGESSLPITSGAPSDHFGVRQWLVREFGHPSEAVLGVRAGWVPAHLAYLTLAEPRRKWGREMLASRTRANMYDGLGHSYLGTGTPDAPNVDLADIAVIPPMVKPAKVKPTLEIAFERAQSVTANAAKARHASTLGKMGIPAHCRGLTVDRVDVTHMPVWLGLLRLREGHRLVAVNGSTDALDEALSTLLTTHISHVRSVLG